jgi:hypothetical protein
VAALNDVRPLNDGMSVVPQNAEIALGSFVDTSEFCRQTSMEGFGICEQVDLLSRVPHFHVVQCRASSQSTDQHTYE